MNRYRFTTRLEAGELAELYRAREETEGLDVVVKLFHARTSDPRYARVVAETAQVLNPLSNEGIVHCVDVGLVKGRLAVVREYVDGYLLGQVLQRLLSKEVVLSAEMALYLIILLAEAVQRAHDAGVVHGALTPGNIILARHGAPYVCDFGALAALHSVPTLKKSFAPRGRSSYRAPEVAQGDEPTIESDIYSLGAIAYELLTLREATTGQGGQLSTRRDALPPPSRLDRRVNGRLDPILMRPLEQLPQRRFKSARDFGAALRNFLASTGGVPTTRDLTQFVSEVFPKELEPQPPGGPLPFAEPVALERVEGADLPPLSEKSMVVLARPSFSGGEVDPTAETDFAVPVFKDPGFGEERTDTGSASPPREEPRFDDGTDPGQAGPLERGWDAPSAVFAAADRGSRSGVSGARAPARNPRVKVIEDFQGPSTASAPAPRSEPSPSGVRRAPPPRQPRPVAQERSETAENPVDSGPWTGNVPRMATSERNLWLDRIRRQRSLFLAVGVAALGVVFFAFALVSRMTAPEPIRAVAAVADPPPEPPPAAPVEPATVYDSPPAKRGAGFLTITADVAAVVYIDGRRVRQRPPLTDYPVEPGMRKVVVEMIRTGERHTEFVSVGRGRSASVSAHFEKKRR